MPVQKVKDLRDLTDDELERKLLDLKDELWRLRFQLATQQLENPMRIREERQNRQDALRAGDVQVSQG